jgi:flagellar export protein FliJ
MLAKFLKIQQDGLDVMLRRKNTLLSQLEEEERRYEQLSKHLEQIGQTNQMVSSLGLQNLSSMRTALLSLQQQQLQKTNNIHEEYERQSQVCRKQAVYNMGLDRILLRKSEVQQQAEIRSEQRVVDEISTQLAARADRLRLSELLD